MCVRILGESMKRMQVQIEDEELYRKAKAKAALEGKTLKELFEALLKEYVGDKWESQVDGTKSKRRM